MKRFFLPLIMLGSLCGFANAKDPIQIRMAVWDGDEALRVLKKVAADFEKANPDIHIKLEPVPYGQYNQKLLTQYAANAAPDVAMMEPPLFQRFASRGALLPLEQFFGDVPGFDIDAYYEPIRKAHTYQGKLYVLPRDIAPIGLIYYNKKLFQEAGIPYPDGSWTWDFEPRPELREKDFTWCMEQLTKKVGGKTVQWGFVPGWPGAWLETMVYSQGLRFANDMERPTKLFYTDPRVVRSYQWVADLSNQKGWMPSPNEITAVMQSSSSMLFLQGKVAMFQSGIWEVPGFRKALKPGEKDFFDWDITLAPGYMDPVTKQVRRAAPTGGSGYGIVSSTEHPKEAWRVLAWMAGEQGMTAMAAAGIAQPAIQRLAVSAPWIPGPNAPAIEHYPATRILTDRAVPYVVFEPTAEYWREVKGFIESKNELILNGSASAKDALALGQGDAENRMAEILKKQDLHEVNWGVGIGAGLFLLAALLVWIYWPDGAPKSSSREKREGRAAYAFASPWIVGVLTLAVAPMILSLVMSFTDWDIITPARWRGGGNFGEAISTDPRFWKTLTVTGIYTVVSVPLGIAFALALALLLNTKVKGMAIYRTCFYLPALASAVASCLIWRRIFQPEGGLLNALIYGADGHGNLLGIGSLIRDLTGSAAPANWLGEEKLALPALIVMSMWSVGGAMIILLAGLQGIPQHYYEAATLDGAGAWRKFRAVTFPLLTPSLFFTLVTGVIGSFQVFTPAFVMTSGGPNDATRFYVLHLYDQAFGNLRMGYASALAWILFAVIMVFTALQFRLNKYVYYESEGAR